MYSTILHLLLGVALEILLYYLEHGDSFTMITELNVGHATTKGCVVLENDLRILRICDYPIPHGVVVNDVTIVFQLWDQ